MKFCLIFYKLSITLLIIVILSLWEEIVPKITSKGQITIPLDIRNSFSMLPGTYVDIIDEKNKVVIVKSRSENKFMKWLGKGKHKNKKDIDLTMEQLRGRIDE